MVLRFSSPELRYELQWQNRQRHIEIGVVVIVVHYFFHVGYFKYGKLYLFGTYTPRKTEWGLSLVY